MKTITVVIDDDGNASVQVDGVEGPSCELLTKALVDAMTDDPSNVKVHPCKEWFLPEGVDRVVGQPPIKTYF